MTTYFSFYWMAFIAQYTDILGDLRTKIAPTRLEAINKALLDIFNTK